MMREVEMKGIMKKRKEKEERVRKKKSKAANKKRKQRLRKRGQVGARKERKPVPEDVFLGEEKENIGALPENRSQPAKVGKNTPKEAFEATKVEADGFYSA